MFTLSVLDPSHGDFSHSWDPNNPEQVENARKLFDDLKKQGYMIYVTHKITETGDVTHHAVHNFDALHASYDFKAGGKKQATATPPAAGG